MQVKESKTQDIGNLERDEAYFWHLYQQANCDAAITLKHGTKLQIRKAQKRATNAHRRHQKCANTILDIHKKRLFEEARSV